MVSNDENGWSTRLKLRAASSPANMTMDGRSAYAGQRFPASRHGDIQQRLGASSPAAITQQFTRQQKLVA